MTHILTATANILIVIPTMNAGVLFPTVSDYRDQMFLVKVNQLFSVR